MGAAVRDYFEKGKAARLRVFSPGFDEDEIPVETLFRDFSSMPAIEQKALELAQGRILDIGAGSGCHSRELMRMGKDVEAVDISTLSVEVMRQRGIRAFTGNIWKLTPGMCGGRYRTLLMLMNGSGIIGTLDNMKNFFQKIRQMLLPEGYLLMDSSDIRYLFEDEGDETGEEAASRSEAIGPASGKTAPALAISCTPTDACPYRQGYYGELCYRMKYKQIIGDVFPWLYIDYPTLAGHAEANGFKAEKIMEGEHFDYLAKLRPVS